MSKITYEQARADHEYLWEIGSADDMTGGYVDQEDLARLLTNPTKATARDCYCDQIAFWFQNGPDTSGGSGSTKARDHIESNPKVREIAIRHSIIDEDEEEEAERRT